MPRPSMPRSPGGPRRSSRRRIRERRQNLLFYTGLLCVCVVSMLEGLSISFSFTQDSFARPAVACGLMCVFLLMNDKEVFRRLRSKAYMNIWLFWGLFVLLMLYSEFTNRTTFKEVNPFTKGLVLQLFMGETLCLMLYALAMDRVDDILRFLLLFMAALIVLTDTLMFGGVHLTDGAFETYLIGTKFDAVYLHLNFAALFLTKLKLSGRRTRVSGAMLLLFVALILLIGLRVDCNTGILGALLLFGLIYACDRWPTLVAQPLSSPRVYLGAIVLSVLFAYYVSWLLNLPVVAHLIVDQLGRSLTLTGRTIIYSRFPGVMRSRWAWGWGYGSAYLVCWRYLQFADVQNALLQWVLQLGVPAASALVGVYGYIMTLYRQKDSLTTSAPLLMLVYMYILLGTVEITFNHNFFLWMMVLFLLACADPKQINDVLPTPVYTPRKVRRRKQLIE